MDVEARSGAIDTAIEETNTLQDNLINKIKKLAKDTSIDTNIIPIESLTEEVINQLSIDDMEIIEDIPLITIKATIANETRRKLTKLARTNETTLTDIIERSVENYDIEQTSANFETITFRSKTLPNCRYNVILNFRKICDLIGDSPEISDKQALEFIVKALPTVNETRARKQYLKTLQEYSIRVNGTRTVFVLNLVNFRHEIDRLMTKIHGFKVGFE